MTRFPLAVHRRVRTDHDKQPRRAGTTVSVMRSRRCRRSRLHFKGQHALTARRTSRFRKVDIAGALGSYLDAGQAESLTGLLARLLSRDGAARVS